LVRFDCNPFSFIFLKVINMDQAYIGAIFPWAGNYAPLGYVFCNGQLLSINDYTAVFSIIGTTYGGDGQTTFAVPNLQGRVPLGASNNTPSGTMAGSNTQTLTTAQLPPHSHPINAYSDAGTTSVPTGNLFANTGTDKDYNPALNVPVTMSNKAIGTTGAAAPFSVQQSYLAINYIMCVEGIYPSPS
jgi:microcystin-dependent protein